MTSVDVRPSRIAVCNLALATETLDTIVGYSVELEVADSSENESLLDWAAGAALDAVDDGLCGANSCVFTITRGPSAEKLLVCDTESDMGSCSVHEESLRVLHTDSCDSEQVRQDAFDIISQTFESSAFREYLTDVSGAEVLRLELSPLALNWGTAERHRSRLNEGGLAAVILSGLAILVLGMIVCWACHGDEESEGLKQSSIDITPHEEDLKDHGNRHRKNSRSSWSQLQCIFPMHTKSYESFEETDSERPSGVVRPLTAVAVPSRSFDTSLSTNVEYVETGRAGAISSGDDIMQWITDPNWQTTDAGDVARSSKDNRGPTGQISKSDPVSPRLETASSGEGSEIILGKSDEKLTIVSFASGQLPAGEESIDNIPKMAASRKDATFIDAVIEPSTSRNQEAVFARKPTSKDPTIFRPDAPGTKHDVKSSSSFGSLSIRPSFSGASSFASSALRSAKSALFSTRSGQAGSSDDKDVLSSVWSTDDREVKSGVLSEESLLDRAERSIDRSTTKDSSLFDTTDDELPSIDEPRTSTSLGNFLDQVDSTERASNVTTDRSRLGDDEKSSKQSGSFLDSRLGDDERSSKQSGSLLDIDDSGFGDIEREMPGFQSCSEDSSRMQDTPGFQYSGSSSESVASDEAADFGRPKYVAKEVNFVRVASPDLEETWRNRKSVQL